MTRPWGSIRKTGFVQGAMYKLANDPGTPLGRGKAGSSTLTLHKDNPGGTGATKGEAVARFVMDSTQPAMNCAINPISPPETLAEMATKTQDATVLAKHRILEALREDGGGGINKTQLREAAKCNFDVFTRALSELSTDLLVSTHKPKGARTELYVINDL